MTKITPANGAATVYHWFPSQVNRLSVPSQVQLEFDEEEECMDALNWRAAASRQILSFSTPRAVSVSPLGIEKSSHFSNRKKSFLFDRTENNRKYNFWQRTETSKLMVVMVHVCVLGGGVWVHVLMYGKRKQSVLYFKKKHSHSSTESGQWLDTLCPLKYALPTDDQRNSSTTGSSEPWFFISHELSSHCYPMSPLKSFIIRQRESAFGWVEGLRLHLKALPKAIKPRL